MEKIHTFEELEDELTLKSSPEGLLRDLIETQDFPSSFEKSTLCKYSNGVTSNANANDSKRSNIDYNKNMLQRKIYKWNFDKSTKKELIDSILLSIFSGGEEGKQIAQDYSKVLIEISNAQSREETFLFLTRMESSLCTNIKAMKDKVYDHKEIKPIYKAYTEFFEIKDKKIVTHLDSNGEAKKLQCTCSTNSHFIKNGTIINFEINDEFLQTVSTLLTELMKLFDVIMSSSKEITLLFQSTFNLLYLEDDTLKPFIASEILKEAFAYVINNDDFIQKMFSIIKTQDDDSNIKEIAHRIEQFESKLAENCKERKRLSCFIQEESMKLKGRTRQNNNIDLDDLVKYINDNQTNENNKKEGKRNKKNMSKKMKKQKQNSLIDNSSNKNNINNNNNDRNCINQEDIKEINAFKNSLRTTSQIKFSFHKIRPILSKEWLSSLNKGLIPD